MSEPVSDVAPPPSPRRLPGVLWFLLAVAVTLTALVAWKAWSSRSVATDHAVDLRPEALDARLLLRPCIVASERLATQSLLLGFPTVLRARDARPASLLAALADHVDARRFR